MKRIGLLLSTAFLASNIAYAETVLTREKLEATTGLSLGYNTSWSSHYVWRGKVRVLRICLLLSELI